jgi:hypothetical protein
MRCSNKHLATVTVTVTVSGWRTSVITVLFRQQMHIFVFSAEYRLF